MTDRPAGTGPSGDADTAAVAQRVAVAVCTWRRPAQLVRTLDHVARAIVRLDAPVSVIVIDNDGADAGVALAVRRFAEETGVDTHFSVETVPGIAAARNAAFARAEQLGIRFLAMLDDDEWPSREWLVELLRTRASTGAVVVGGPVSPEFPAGAARLAHLARYWSVEPQMLHGRPFVFCTCNFLVDLARIADEPRPLFDPAFGLSGGEDVVFFRRLFFRGHPMAWSAGAVVHEEVPPDRANLGWMRRRRFGVGLNAVRWERENGRVRTALKSVALTGRLLFYPLLGREPGSRLVGWLLEAEKVRGRLAAHFGRGLTQYRTGGTDGAPSRACRD